MKTEQQIQEKIKQLESVRDAGFILISAFGLKAKPDIDPLSMIN